MSLSIRAIARRCYNYEMMVSTDPLYKSRQVLFTTGSFLVDFGTYALEDNPRAISQDSTSQSIMKDFIDVVKRYEQAAKLSESRMHKVQRAFIDALTQHGRFPEWLVKGDIVREWLHERSGGGCRRRSRCLPRRPYCVYVRQEQVVGLSFSHTRCIFYLSPGASVLSEHTLSIVVFCG